MKPEERAEIRARADRRDELAERIRQVCESVIEYDDNDWTRIADLVLPMMDAADDAAREWRKTALYASSRMEEVTAERDRARDLAARLEEEIAAAWASPYAVVPHGSCHVGPGVRSQWRNNPHFHVVWPNGGTWCFETRDEAIERGLRLNEFATRAAHGPLPGSHERPDGPVCLCGRWSLADCPDYAAQETARELGVESDG